MRMQFIVSCTAVLALSPLCAPAAPAAPNELKVFRNLTWHVDVGVTHRSERERSSTLGSGDAGGGSGTQQVAGGTDVQAAHAAAAVDVSIDIVGALANNGLAAIVSEKGDRTQEPVRLDIMADGTVIIPPADQAKVTAEEVQIAELCARSLFTGHPLVAGESWSKAGGDGHVKTTSSFRIKDYLPDGIVVVEVEQTLHGSVAGSVSQRATGLVRYDAARTVPVAARLSRVTQSGQIGALTTTEESFDYRLTADTLPRAHQ
jgi:hypothetical protein